jgi:hypothetical protein
MRLSYSNYLIYSVYAANIFILNIVLVPILSPRLTAVFPKVGLQCLLFIGFCAELSETNAEFVQRLGVTCSCFRPLKHGEWSAYCML